MYIADIGVQCPDCGAKFSSKQVPVLLDTGKRNSELRQDFEGVLPQFEKYAVCTCPSCGKSDWVNRFESVEPNGTILLEQAPAKPHLQFKQAAVIAERQGKDSYSIGMFYLHAAWCADDEKEAIAAQQYRRLCHEFFKRSLSDHSCPVQTRMEIEYLLGELLRRTGNFEGARMQFQQVISKLSGKFAYMARKLMRMAELGKTEAIPFEMLNKAR